MTCRSHYKRTYVEFVKKVVEREEKKDEDRG